MEEVIELKIDKELKKKLEEIAESHDKNLYQFILAILRWFAYKDKRSNIDHSSPKVNEDELLTILNSL